MRKKWGNYWVLLNRKHFKVKLLRFRAYGELSTQYHNKRNELWLFLSGTGKMIVDGEVYNRDENYNGAWFSIPKGKVHKYSAWRTTWVLEIQYGDECCEEDIVRLA